MNSFIIGQYVPKISWIHQLDPRTKLIIVFSYVIVIFAADSALGYGILLALAFLSTYLIQIPFKFIAKGLKPVWWIMVFTFILHLIFTRQGDMFISVLGFGLYDGAIIKAIEISLRFFLLILMTTVLTLTTTPIAITDAVETLLGPFKKLKLPVHELAMMMSISLRFIPTLMQEMDKITKAQASRGLDFKTGTLKDRAKAVLPLFIPLFINAFRRAEDLAVAMDARGYQGAYNRTKFRELKFTGLDYIIGLFVITVFAVFFMTGT
ncbi:energy-coupling factor transporter transmembrane component T family protein [Aquisalibacillus elongatus]|uniref:Energy-coupling factor transport system permease protein n=1 Tax=Aquisalibacillus elongatus TaxID=485577 RepID=A0A3N5BK15_9BACI|nr:energy-coupling factor transporter transmembrane component T [Aquisalibacillus elongatus]RPF50018.1 energy-coupling factor transport system permease protein [Aquisalibacillus elongatus]